MPAVIFVLVVAVVIIAGFRVRAVREWIATRGGGLTSEAPRPRRRGRD